MAELMRITDGLLLTGRALELAGYAVKLAQRFRARNALPPLAALDQLATALAAPGQPDTPAEPVGDPETVTTDQAAELLNCSTRQARRLAPALGGRLVGGRWLLDRQAVTEHLEGMTR